MNLLRDFSVFQLFVLVSRPTTSHFGLNANKHINSRQMK